MLVDEVTIEVRAGDGGKGAVAFQKVRLSQGPTGGDGGRGGSVYVEGVSDISALGAFANKQIRKAENGQNGRGQFIDGHSGEDLVLKVPMGTTITNTESGYRREITEVGERVLIAGGGRGGRGNFKFRSSTNTSPKESEEGAQGDRGVFTFELRLIADIGLVGLPNAGKSSLLNELTAAQSRVGSYAFTTLEAHLGAYYGLIIADIPGLIEGASEGKGLGTKFLKHIERTRVLFHLVAADGEDPLADYETVRKELAAYSEALVQKPEYVFLTKADAVDEKRLNELQSAFKKKKINTNALSILEPDTLEAVHHILRLLQKEKESGSSSQ